MSFSAFWSLGAQAVAVLLVEEESNPGFAPVTGNTCWSVNLKALDTLDNQINNLTLGLLKDLIQGAVPIEFFCALLIGAHGGTMISAWGKLYATWLTRWNPELMPVILMHVGKLALASAWHWWVSLHRQ